MNLPFQISWGKVCLLFLVLCLLVVSLACTSPSDSQPVLKVGGIPDQDTARLARRYSIFSDYLQKELGVNVEYVPSANYAAVVTAFGQGELQLAFFGGLTGVQARQQNPGAVAIAQRENDAVFHSKFIARADLDLESLEDVKANAADYTITFGSESSTSGHLMPRHFLVQTGIDPDEDFRTAPSYSGSHDNTWLLVQSGSYDIGALNEEVWDRAIREGKADPAKVKEFYTTPDYYDYNWTAQGNLDDVYGDGFTSKVQAALFRLNPEEHGEILELFSTEKFIETDNSNYSAIEDVARELGMIR
ncbi:MAG: putative selenate ABC transporter substrate-binding protein [Chloroflexota bacterium]|nr:putative selenate ABC transporter substrate-binding protein [Chloroflexota bacterium]